MGNSSQIKMGVTGLFIAVSIFYLCTFVVDQTQYAIRIQLGDPVEVYKTPGLKFKVPFITQIFYVDNRILTYDSDPGAIITKDKKEMVVDNFSKWRVEDPLKFYETVRNVVGAQTRLDDLVYSQLREALGKHTVTEIIAGERHDIMKEITENSREAARVFGIDIVDVRIKRADLPESNSRAVFGRMEEERRREAMRYRSEGAEVALKIRSEADREKIEILATAQREAQEIKGVAEAEALKIYADTYQQDPEFFSFQRSHDAYREVMKEGTTVLLSSEREFFKFLQ